MRVWHVLGWLLLSVACATDNRAIRSAGEDTGSRIVLATGDGPPLVVRPTARRAPVEVTAAQYEAAMVQLARELRDELPALPSQRLAVVSWGSQGERDEAVELVRDYFQWCDRRDTPGDCLHLLKGPRLYLTDAAKRDLAFALATAGVWEGTAAVVGEVLDPVQFQQAVMASIATAMTLLLLPDPVSKALVVTLTLSMVAYVGWDTLWGLIQGWDRMTQEAKRARTFSELREAGERYGRVMGEKVTRLLILAATAAMGSAGGQALGGRGLPGFIQASQRLATESGIVRSAVGQVRSVKVTGKVLTVSLAPNALAMANQGMSSGGGGPPSTSSSGSKHRLVSVESWRKPRFTEDGRIMPFQGTREPASPIPNLGQNRAGQTVSRGQTTVRFDKDGFPEFETEFELLLGNSHIGSGKPELHFKAANRKLFDAIQADPGLARTLKLNQAQVDKLLSAPRAPEGYVWHHHQDAGRMQLIIKDSHLLARPHTGGMAIWGGGY